MEKKTADWHHTDVARELEELSEARRIVDRWSELSDVYYTYGRARADGHVVEYPLPAYTKLPAMLYMIPKYTLRYWFFRKAGKRVDPSSRLTEVRNPKKVHKLHHIAAKYSLDPLSFEKTCTEQLKRWILLP